MPRFIMFWSVSVRSDASAEFLAKNGPEDPHVACHCSAHSFSAVVSSTRQRTCLGTCFPLHRSLPSSRQSIMQSLPNASQVSQDLLEDSEDHETSGRHIQISQLAKSQASQDLFDESQLTEVDGLQLTEVDGLSLLFAQQIWTR